MAKKDYYELLGVSKTDSKDSIKKAYKKLALKYHPDRAPETKKEEYESKFKEISEAYSVLSDDAKKSQYDSHGHSAFDGRSGPGHGFGGGGFGFDDIFGGGDFDFGNIFGGGRSRQRRKMGEDLQYRITIEFEEAVFGCEKEIVIEKNESCSSCDGTGSKDKEFSNCLKCGGRGRVIIEHETSFGRLRQEAACDECEGDGKVSKNKCKKCSGRGVVFEKKKIKIKIPRGIDNDQVIRVGGGGNDVKGGISGDLMVVVRVKPHDVFQRDGNNIIVDLELNFSKAALGCKISIPTLHGDEKIKIAPGVESGTILRLRRKGVSDVNGYGVGDQFVNIKVITPKKLNRKQKKLFNELAKLEE